MLHAAGGSTNAVIHLAAIAGRVGVPFPLDDIGRSAPEVPVLADVEPSGTGLMQDFHAAGGLPAAAGRAGTAARPGAGHRHRRDHGRDRRRRAAAPSGAIRRRGDPLRTGGAFAVVRGSLAPDGAVIKTSAATPGTAARTAGPAVVFRGYDDMRRRVDDPDLDGDRRTACSCWPAAARSACPGCRSGA